MYTVCLQCVYLRLRRGTGHCAALSGPQSKLRSESIRCEKFVKLIWFESIHYKLLIAILWRVKPCLANKKAMIRQEKSYDSANKRDSVDTCNSARNNHDSGYNRGWVLKFHSGRQEPSRMTVWICGGGGWGGSVLKYHGDCQNLAPCRYSK